MSPERPPFRSGHRRPGLHRRSPQHLVPRRRVPRCWRPPQAVFSLLFPWPVPPPPTTRRRGPDCARSAVKLWTLFKLVYVSFAIRDLKYYILDSSLVAKNRLRWTSLRTRCSTTPFNFFGLPMVLLVPVKDPISCAWLRIRCTCDLEILCRSAICTIFIPWFLVLRTISLSNSFDFMVIFTFSKIKIFPGLLSRKFPQTFVQQCMSHSHHLFLVV